MTSYLTSFSLVFRRQGFSFILLGIIASAPLTLLPGRTCAASEATAQELSLAGPWQFTTVTATLAPPTPPQSSAFTDTMTVPGNWDTTNRYAHYVGQGWYRRTFTLPADWQGSRVHLRFEAVYETARVWLNGTLLGSHTCGYLPFEFNTTAHLKPFGQANELIVMADNTYSRGAWWSWGGISRDVKLIRFGDVRILSQHVTAEPDLKSGSAKLDITYQIENAGSKTGRITLRPSLMPPGAADYRPLELATGKNVAQVEAAAHTTATVRLKATLSPEQVKLWHFDHPNLYRLETQVLLGGIIADTKADRFGIRKVECREGRFFLNGEPMRLCGFNRVSDDRIHGNTEPDELVKRDVDMMKSMGAVMARLMHYPQSLNLLDYLDEKGFMIFEEIPVWSHDDPNIIKGNPRTKQWLREEIARDFNHPCIIGWSVGNELDHHYDYVQTMLDAVREYDPSRLATYISNSIPRPTVNRQNDPATLCDIIHWNTYGGYKTQADHIRQQWPEKTQFVSEFGGGMIGPSIDAKLDPKVIEGFELIRRDYPWVAGISLWTFNDYRSRFRGSQANEERGWGVVNVWRQEKRAAQQIREQYSPITKMELGSSTEVAPAPTPGSAIHATLRIEPRRAGDLPSFILTGYTIHWETSSLDGTPAASGSLSLPTIKPGDKPLAIPFDWKVPAGGGRELSVRLVSSTGYAVHEIKVPFLAPASPTIRAITTGKGIARVFFTRVPGASEYVVHYGTQALDHAAKPTIADYAWISGLQTGKEYQFTVKALNGKGAGAYSATVRAKIASQPLPPMIWNVTPLDGGFNVGYMAEAGDKTFMIEYGTAPGKYDGKLENITLRGSCNVTGLKNGQTYYLRMKRDTKNGESGWSPEEKVTPAK